MAKKVVKCITDSRQMERLIINLFQARDGWRCAEERIIKYDYLIDCYENRNGNPLG